MRPTIAQSVAPFARWNLMRILGWIVAVGHHWRRRHGGRQFRRATRVAAGGRRHDNGRKAFARLDAALGHFHVNHPAAHVGIETESFHSEDRRMEKGKCESKQENNNCIIVADTLQVARSNHIHGVRRRFNVAFFFLSTSRKRNLLVVHHATVLRVMVRKSHGNKRE